MGNIHDLALVILGAAWLGGCGPRSQAKSEATGNGSTGPDPGGERIEGSTPHRLASKDPKNVGIDLASDVCEKQPDGSLEDPIPAGRYTGILRNARCKQEKFATMAAVAAALQVECKYCHLPDPVDPTKEIYERVTTQKQQALWMCDTFIKGLSPVDGTQIQCVSCHAANDTHQGRAKILGDPRDRDYAQQWMHEVLTTKFVEASGRRLKCKTCHVGIAPDQNGWIKNVIGTLRYVPATGLQRITDSVPPLGRN